MNQIENMATQQPGDGGEVEKAFVLWDMGNCPIPDGHDPLMVVGKIQMAVEKSGHVRRNGQISITAIGSKLTEIPGEDVMRRLSSFEISLKHAYRNKVGKTLIGLRPEHCGQYVALSTLSALGNNWAEAEEMRKVMIEAGIRKIPAYSVLS
ncbi:hypothetical protein DY000_02044901 [Brassica cretica]|uniref:NYN domain-containing protein n=1 Tax=Brassica cretica TaxID=69181 RepID=A0ABQ7F4A6_BRACR|nr:hypothetical protein DY000_02044901 [Brassica cretica]